MPDTEAFTKKLQEIRNKKLSHKVQAEYQAELEADQINRYNKAKELHKKNKTQGSEGSMQSYSTWEHATYGFFNKLYSLQKERDKSPRYDITITILQGFNGAIEMLGQQLDKFGAPRVSIEYAIEIDDKGNPSFMLTSNGDKVPELEAEFQQLVTEGIRAAGYSQTATGFVDRANLPLTQDKFDADIAPGFKKLLEQGLIVHDNLENRSSLKP